MKRNLLFIIIILYASCIYGQTSCPLDESVFSGTLTVTTAGASKTKASDATSNHRFGERVAIDGNIAAVVSRSNGTAAGKVYIYTNDGTGNWTEQTILTASDGFAGDNFGSAIALEGNYLIVGARSQLNTSAVDTGAAYLFEYNGVNTWTEVAIFEPSDGAAGYRFGEAVSIEGDLILIGARNGCTGGCAYLYENDGTNMFTYTETKLEPQVQSGYSGAKFGQDVLLKNGRAYVGGPSDYSSVGRASAGSVQIWDQANDGTWSRTHRLRGTETSESFGWAVDAEGDYLAVGAMNFEVSSTAEADQGRVFVYKADANGDYLEANKVTIQNDDKDSFTDQRFGTDVALDGEFLYVGTWGDGNTNGDAVYVFKDDGTNNWSQIAKITSGAGWDEFSNRAVAVSFPYLLIGQNEDDSPSNSGAIYFVPLANTIAPVASVTETVGVNIGQDNGILKLSFDDEATETQIKFSIDGGNNYAYTFDDDLGTAEITNLAMGSYDVWVAFDETSCPVNLGSFDINQAAYTTIPDTNFEAALFALGHDDISGDGQVPTAWIEVVTSLNVNNQGISDLTGIQDFTALESLRLQYNNLTSLDVSNNTALKTLWAANGNIFNSIDVSNNVLLEDFRLRQYRGTSIDISNNTALTRFACTSCDLLTVDTSANINLSFLDLWDSDITNIDVSTNVNLGTLDVAYTNLTSIDLTTNTLVTSLIANDISTLTSLNIQNGTNTNITTFNTSNTPISCVQVDDATYSTTNWTNIDGATNFTNGYCQYTDIPDVNFEAALEALGYDDISADGQVPTALIEVVTSLDVSNQTIADLTGIADFVALTYLDCEDNSLTNLDVRNNTNLETLIFDNNNVATLSLGANTNLDRIEARFNQLNTVDLSQNTGITFINIRTNPLTSIDVSNNVNLETLTVIECSLTSIDLTNNVNLKNAYLRNNNFTTIDISQNALLENLSLDGMSLTSLDVSSNPALKILRITDNSIETLDLTNNTALTDVECENNSLRYINLKNGNNAAITTFLATGNPSLSCIIVDDPAYSTTNWTNIDVTTSFNTTFCSYTAIPDANFEARLEALGYDDISADGQVPTALIETVTALDLNSQNITDITGIENFTALEELYAALNTFTSLDLTNNPALKILWTKFTPIATLNISANTNLEQLVCSFNDLSSLDVSTNTLLTYLECNNNSIATLDVATNTALLDLRCGNNGLTNIDLTTNTLVTTFWCQENSITSLDLTNQTNLTSFTGNNNSLTSLDIRNGNNINITNFVATNNPSLSCIQVDDATYSTTNWAGIDVSTSFSTTYCNYTAIPDPNFEAALETLGYDDISGDGQVPTVLIETVGTLDVGDENISDLTGIENFAALTSLRCHNNSIQNLDLSNNTLLNYIKCDDNNMDTINFGTNANFEELIGFGNDFTSIDFSNLPSLRKISIFNNELTELDLSNNPALVFIRLDNNNLTYLNIKNGTNTNITTFNTNLNTSLSCILVDDAAYSTTNWTSINPTTSFNDQYCRYTAIPDANFEARLEALGLDDISADGQVPTALIEVVTNLNLVNNGITDITGIEDFIALTSLNVSDNTIGSLDISNSPNLVTLTANACSLTSLDVSQNTLLETLSADSNQLTSLNTTNNIALRSVVLYGNLIVTADFSTNTLLENLDLFQNKLTALDLSTNSVLKTLFCDNNELTSLNVQNGNNIAITDFNVQNNDDLYCILVDDEAYSTTNWANKDAQTSYNETSCDYVIVDIDVFLQGALINPNTGEETLMRDDLRVNGPLYGATSPYGDGAVMTDDVAQADNDNNSTVDWIWVELRDAGSPTTVIAGQSGVLQRDGDIVDTSNDSNPLTFDNVPAGNYFIVIKHRNHLGIMSATAITLKQVSTTIDFTDANNEITYGSNAQTTFGMPTDVVTMWSGNANEDAIVQYSGTDPDTPNILSIVLNDAGNFLNFPTYVVSGYNPDDVNLDGNTQYSGTDPDVPFILQNVLAHPSNFLNFSTYQIIEQLPENE